jgi:RNA polymerase sigma-70 factor, ECF subfamily
LPALLADCATGDQAAFDRLYRLTAPKLFALAIRILQRRDIAEEVLQESFVRIWRNAQAYEAAKAHAMTWMSTIVRNTALDWLRRPNLESPLDLTEGADPPDEAPLPMASLQLKEEENALHNCIKELGAPERQCIALAYFRGLSNSELAEQLSVPLGTIKSWIRRSMMRLRECLER